MAGRKFGAEGDLSLTWAMNAHVPRPCRRKPFRTSRIVAVLPPAASYSFVPGKRKRRRRKRGPRIRPANTRNPASGRRAACFEYFSRQIGPPPGRLFRLNLRDRHAIRACCTTSATKMLGGKRSTVSLGHVQLHLARAMPQPRRCAALRTATHADPRRSMSAAMRSSGYAISQPQLGALARPRADHCRDRGAEPPGSPTPRRRSKCSACPIVDTKQLTAWTAELGSPARCPAWASPPNSRCAMAATDVVITKLKR